MATVQSGGGGEDCCCGECFDDEDAAGRELLESDCEEGGGNEYSGSDACCEGAGGSRSDCGGGESHGPGKEQPAVSGEVLEKQPETWDGIEQELWWFFAGGGVDGECDGEEQDCGPSSAPGSCGACEC